MNNQTEITMYIPSEHVKTLMEVISIGLQRAKLSPEERENFKAWFEAEREFIYSDIKQNV